MMKRLFTLAIISILFQGVSAQTWNMNIFTKTDTTNLAGTTYHIVGDAARFETKKDFYTVMTSDDSMLVAIKRVELNVLAGTYEYFCWEVCYAEVAAHSRPIWYADDSLWVYKNDTILNFSTYYRPEMQLGSSCYRYVFTPADKPGDSTYIDICFDMLTIGLDQYSLTSVEVFPNPAADMVRINLPESVLDQNVTARLIDYQGRILNTKRLTSISNTIELSENLPGVYMLQLLDENGKSEIRKLVIE